MSELKRLIAFNIVLLTVIALVGFVLVKGLVLSDHAHVVNQLRSILPLLDEYKVRIFQKHGDYNVLAYGRGQFCSKQGSACTNLQPEQPFDTQAVHDFAVIGDALSASSVPVYSVDAQLNSLGKVSYAVFELSCLLCGTDRYNYSPNSGDLPAQIPGVFWYNPINQGWYLTHEK